MRHAAAMLLLFSVLLCAGGVLSRAPAGLHCPAGCDCALGSTKSYECPSVTVRANDKHCVEVLCMEDHFDCAVLPNIYIGENKTLYRLEITDCLVPANVSIACAARASEASGAERLLLMRPKGELTVENVKGLDVEGIYMSGAINQVTFPIAAVNSQPHLRSFRLSSAAAIQLHTDMFLDSPPLEYLEISNSGITLLPEGAFNGLTHLRNLSIWGNDFRNISVDAFKGLANLTQLVLERNPIQTYPVGVFHRAPRLMELRAKRNEVRSVVEGVFSGMQELRYIELNGKDLTLGAKAFSNLPSLEYLSIQSSGVRGILSDLFENTTRITTLLLNDNKIRQIPENLFQNLKLMKLLDLSINQIESISKEMIQNCESLETLDLYKNRIEVLPEQLFARLSKLEVVNLSRNRIHTISQWAFWGASFPRLSMAHNRFNWSDCYSSQLYYNSPLYSFEGKLHELDLSHNEISCVFDDWRFVLLGLKKLDLSYNAFTDLTKADVKFSQNKIEVDFRHNQISYIQLDEYVVKDDDMVKTNNAKLYIDNNSFNCDCHLYGFISNVQSPDSSFVLDNAECSEPQQLQNQSLSSISPYVLTCPIPDTPNCSCLARPAKISESLIECDCDSLEYLPDPRNISQYRGNPVTISLRLLSDTVDLRTLSEYVRILNLTGLGLSTINIVPNTVELLDITNNSITNIPIELLNSKMKLKIAGNPLQCDCWNAEEVTLLQRQSSHIIDLANVTCADGSKINQVDSARLCGVYQATVIGTLLAISGILLALIAAILYTYWVEIQVYLYDKRIFLFLLPKEDIDCDKKYDVFVSFANEDELFIVQEILPRIEGNYITTVQDRDFEPGAAIPTEIRRSIEQSRRTLIVLTSNFMKSFWASEAFRAVHSQATNDKRTRAVVLLIDVNKKELNKDMSTYLSLSTFVKWGDRMCWERVKYALPRKDMYDYKSIETAKANKTQFHVSIDDIVLMNKSQAVMGKFSHGLHIMLNEEGKLVNKGYVKEI